MFQLKIKNISYSLLLVLAAPTAPNTEAETPEAINDESKNLL